jgi:hypothetical protein
MIPFFCLLIILTLGFTLATYLLLQHIYPDTADVNGRWDDWYAPRSSTSSTSPSLTFPRLPPPSYAFPHLPPPSHAFPRLPRYTTLFYFVNYGFRFAPPMPSEMVVGWQVLTLHLVFINTNHNPNPNRDGRGLARAHPLPHLHAPRPARAA